VGWACSTYGRQERWLLGVGWETLRKSLLERPRLKREDTNKIDLQEVRLGGMDWLDVTQDKDRWLALVSAVMNLRVP